MAINTKAFIEKFLKIKDKKANIIDFKLNPAQCKLYDAIARQYAEGKPVRAIILKARQMGFSTLAEAMIYKDSATHPNVASGIVAHESVATTNLFTMSKRYHDTLDEDLRPSLKASNARELIFDHADGASSIKCMTAGNDSIGRSDTFQNLHISEYAYWNGNKEETLTGLLQAVPHERNTMVIIESTANGYDDFKDLWDRAVAGESDFVPVFCAWWEHGEYTLPVAGIVLTEEERRLKDAYHLTDGQLAWRRWCIKNNCGGNKDLFAQEYPACPEEAFLMSGRPVFDNEKIMRRLSELTAPEEISFRYTWHNADSEDYIESYEVGNGKDIRIYEHPRPGVPYVIGGDTKGEGRDYYAATVIDNITGKRVATLHMRSDHSKPYTHQLYCLGKYYNDALIGVEMNFNTGPIEELQRLKYPRQYMRRTYDSRDKKEQKKYGWKTDGNTRPLIIDREIDCLSNHIELFNDAAMLRECITFVYDENGRPDAISGKHDDLLFSDMIANEIRTQQRAHMKEEPHAEIARYERDLGDFLEYGE